MKENFLFTEEAKYSYTHNDILIVLIEWLKYWMKLNNLTGKNCCLINGTACTGWDNILLSNKIFDNSVLFEISKKNYKYLAINLKNYMNIYKPEIIESENNIKLISNRKIIVAYNTDTIKQIKKLDETIKSSFNLNNYIIYLDIPWTGKNYYKINKLTLSFGNYKLEEFIKYIFEECNNISFLLLKLPFNYDKELLFSSIYNSNILDSKNKTTKKLTYKTIDLHRMFFVLIGIIN